MIADRAAAVELCELVGLDPATVSDITVEISVTGPTVIVATCVYPGDDGAVVRMLVRLVAADTFEVEAPEVEAPDLTTWRGDRVFPRDDLEAPDVTTGEATGTSTAERDG